jgi:putative membrane protein
MDSADHCIEVIAMASVLAQMMDWGDTHGGDGWAWLWIGGFAFMVLVVVLGVVLIVRFTSPSSPSSSRTEETRRFAEDVLADRLARGEIDPVEYRDRLDALRSG